MDIFKRAKGNSAASILDKQEANTKETICEAENYDELKAAVEVVARISQK